MTVTDAYIAYVLVTDVYIVLMLVTNIFTYEYIDFLLLTKGYL